MSREELHEEVKKGGLTHVCLTGGEPLLQPDLPELATELMQQGYIVSVETGGHMDISVLPPGLHRICDIKTPGAFQKSATIQEELFINTEFFEENIKHLNQSDEIKFVVADMNEMAWVQEVIRRFALNERVHAIHISPVHDSINVEEMARWIVEQRLPARMTLQIHKYIFGVDAIGV
jgi:7-carboxy-7-deazaguanine synthase